MDFVLPIEGASLELVSGRGHYERVVAAVLEARRSVWIATANLKELMVESPGLGRRRRYRSVLQVLAELSERGVELRILHAGFPSRAFREHFDALPALVRGGLELRMCPRVHLKTICALPPRRPSCSTTSKSSARMSSNSSRRNLRLPLERGHCTEHAPSTSASFVDRYQRLRRLSVETAQTLPQSPSPGGDSCEAARSDRQPGSVLPN